MEYWFLWILRLRRILLVFLLDKGNDIIENYYGVRGLLGGRVSG